MSDHEELSEQPLTRRRGQAKAAISRFKSYLSKFDVRTGDLEELELRLDKLHINELDWLECHQKIDEGCAAENINSENQKLIEFEDLVFQVISTARKHIKTMTMEKHQGDSISTHLQQTVVYRNSSNMGPLVIAPFDGDREDWLRYKEMFSAIMGKQQPPPDNIEKLHRLKQTCIGEALKVINGLSYTDRSFDIAWEMLINKYEDMYTLVSLQAQNLLQLEPVQRNNGQSLSELIDSVCSAIASLNSLKVDTSTWDVIIICIVVAKLDETTRQLWQSQLVHNKLPTWGQLLDFLSQRARVLISNSTLIKASSPSSPSASRKVEHHVKVRMSQSMAATSSSGCIKCNLNHRVDKCPSFKSLTISCKYDLLKRSNCCFICLEQGHIGQECRSTKMCEACNGYHHTLLHSDRLVASPAGCFDSNEEPATVCHQRTSKGTVALATAIVLIKDEHGRRQRCRALLDIGSMEHFMTENLVKRLGLKKSSNFQPIGGINETISQSKATVMTVIESTTEPVRRRLTFLVVPKVTGQLPGAPVNITSWRIPPGIKLADPSFHQPQQVDMLLGGGVFCDLLKSGKIKLARGQPYLLSTKLGWVVSGPFFTKDARQPGGCATALATFSGVMTNQLCEQPNQDLNVDEIISKTSKAEKRDTSQKIQLTIGNEKQEESLISKRTNQDSNSQAKTQGGGIRRNCHRDERKQGDHCRAKDKQKSRDFRCNERRTLTRNVNLKEWDRGKVHYHTSQQFNRDKPWNQVCGHRKTSVWCHPHLAYDREVGHNQWRNNPAVYCSGGE